MVITNVYGSNINCETNIFMRFMSLVSLFTYQLLQGDTFAYV